MTTYSNPRMHAAIENWPSGSIEDERPAHNYIVLHTSLGSFGFLPDHWVEVDAEQMRA